MDFIDISSFYIIIIILSYKEEFKICCFNKLNRPKGDEINEST